MKTSIYFVFLAMNHISCVYKEKASFFCQWKAKNGTEQRCFKSPKQQVDNISYSFFFFFFLVIRATCCSLSCAKIEMTFSFYADSGILQNSKVVGDRSRGRPVGSLFNSYYTEM